MRSTLRAILAALPLLPAVVFMGCAGDGDSTLWGFISDDPTRGAGANAPGYDGGEDLGAGGQSNGETTSTATTTEGTGGSGAGEQGEVPEDPERLIAEADIVQVHDGKLYALSQYSGLSIIDVSVRDQLTVIGRHQIGGVPFEMYLRDGIVYAMFSSWGQYVELEGGYWEYVQTSHIEALDVTIPRLISTVGSFDMPGTLADSRMVGDVIYVVTFEDGYCYNCRPEPNTTVTSITAGNPASIGIVDQLSFDDPQGDYGTWHRSISVTTDRMYVGGVDWTSGWGDTSTIQVVDISDPAGTLVEGDTVEVAGQIQSRWQMDEYEGVLRVVSQPWDATVFPSVETFQVVSSQQLVPLGSVTLTLPQPESLRSVRFDGTRGYAITAEVQVGDPLYTIDLSDPAAPAQVGTLEMPGWVHHIEPRGDRLLALGFDPDHADGGLNVSLFDVSDMAAPALMRRVHFGGDWGNYGEDQDRIHKAFKILPDLGLLLVPFSAWMWNDYGCSSYESGIQLVDWANDDIVKRGVAPVRGEARRAFMVDDRLFAMSDEQVRTFDIADRDAPEKKAELMLAATTNQVVVAGDYVVRLAADWWTSEPRLEVVPGDDPGRLQALGGVNLGAMLAQAEQDESCWGWSYWDVRVFAEGNRVMLVWPSWRGDVARVATVDISDPTAPVLGAHLDVPVSMSSYGGYYGYYSSSLLASGEPIAQLGTSIAFLSVEVPTDEYGYPIYWEQTDTVRAASLYVVDFADAAAPRLASTVPLPMGGGHTGLVTDGTKVLFSHWDPIEGSAGKVRFFLDRIDLANPDGPVTLPMVNVPGSLIAFDAPSQNLLTVDYQREAQYGVTQGACRDQYGYVADFTPDDPNWWEDYNYNWENVIGTCVIMHRTFRLSNVPPSAPVATLLDEEPLPDGVSLQRLLVGDDRVLTTTYPYYWYDDGNNESELWAIGGLRAGDLRIATRTLEADSYWSGWSPLEVEGQRMVAISWWNTVVTIDTADLDDIAVTEHDSVPWSIYSAEIDGDRAILSLGPYGVYVASLEAAETAQP